MRSFDAVRVEAMSFVLGQVKRERRRGGGEVQGRSWSDTRSGL